MSKHVAGRVFTGSMIMEEAARRADRLRMVLPCFGRHCTGEHLLPTTAPVEVVADDFPMHVTYSFHRGIPIPSAPATTSSELAKIILSGTYGKAMA